MQQRQWRNPHDQQDQPPSAKIPKLLHDENQSSETAPAVTAAAAGLSLSVEEPNSSKNSSRLLAFPDPTLTRYPRRGLFSLAQRQELELQALIFKHMLTGASVPLDLVLLLRRSMLNTPAAYYHHRHNILPYYPQHYLHYQQSRFVRGPIP
ncbi:hypothetical protein ACLOJK_031259 [Asimina triloba]